MIEKQRKKDLAASYKQSFRRMGVYQLRNTANGKLLICGSMDLDGARNRLAFMQQTNTNSMPEIQQDWKLHGGDSFVYEELDEIKPKEEFAGDREEMKKYKKEVDALLGLWVEKLKPFGEAGYNQAKRLQL
ncbi:GIY-YIG nuclease family protein [Paenibacillus sp. HB172176]|uniref:GIY-YIG nuclease family protein n=1 Tax=Paenibacillus sp. HB172176 TaxID=2493690 RepID=UPI00143B1D5D|nr:GIY-YIG nuclease family protein [Paenibacillus sp. HB172176]